MGECRKCGSHNLTCKPCWINTEIIGYMVACEDCITGGGVAWTEAEAWELWNNMNKTLMPNKNAQRNADNSRNEMQKALAQVEF